ncbi:hypothetical protein GF325_04650 [Candidatus Bathyarchaeota archaeon]|nr:hypothetical protein [Candidatus Bathyarchaeota archaeon]
MSSAIGTMFAGLGGPDIFADMMMLIFGQVQNFSDTQILPNVFVLNASAGENTTSTVQRTDTRAFTVTAPYTDPSGDGYFVETTRDYEVDITFNQEANVIFILWDDDGSFIRLLKRIINIVKAAIDYFEGGGMGSIPNELIEEAIKTFSWALLHVNDIFTGDEQFIFQPSYYWTYEIQGNITDTHDWYHESGSPVADPSSLPGMAGNTTENPYLDFLTVPSVSKIGETMYDSGFLFHLFQFWMQRFQINIDMEKIGEIINNGTGVSEETLMNLLEGVDVRFSFTQHHLLGGALYNDTNGDDLPSVLYETLDAQYNDSRGRTMNVTVPTSSEVKYKIDLANASGGWTVQDPTKSLDGKSFSWGVTFNNPTLAFVPVGMDDYESHLAGTTIEHDMSSLSFGFTFEPSFETLPVPDENGNQVKQVRFGKGTIKLDQGFGDIAGGVHPNLTGLGLGVIYFSHVFEFDFRYINEPDQYATDIGNYYRNETGTLDFLDADDKDYFGAIDIAGPEYTISSGPEAGNHSSVTDIVPFALFNYTFEAERNIENDEFSISTGEAAFRHQSLYVDLTSAWAFYVVAYPNWDGNELIHDPTFSTFMTLDKEIPWTIILLIAVGGAIVAASLVLYFKKQGRF